MVCNSEAQQRKAPALENVKNVMWRHRNRGQVQGVFYGVPTDITIDEILQKVKGGKVSEAK